MNQKTISTPSDTRSTSFGLALHFGARFTLALALGAASACSGADSSFDEVGGDDVSPADSALAEELGTELGGGIEEPALTPEIIAAMAASKGFDPDATSGLVQKHANCNTSGPTDISETNVDAPSGGAANQRSGSSTGCAILGVLQPSDDALYFCFTIANDGATWTYNQNLRTGKRGWTRDDLLDISDTHPELIVGGAPNVCPPPL